MGASVSDMCSKTMTVSMSIEKICMYIYNDACSDYLSCLALFKA